MKQTIDLHIHTTCSDGEKTPKQIIDYAKKMELTPLPLLITTPYKPTLQTSLNMQKKIM